MIYRTEQIKIDNYFSNTASMSQSALKKLITGVGAFTKKDEEKELYYEEKGHFIIGSGVDVWLTQGADAFDRQFVWFTAKKPSAKIMSICHKIFDEANTDDAVTLREVSINIILDVAEEHEYQPRYGDEAKIRAIIKEGDDYFAELIVAGGRQMCDDDQWRIIHEIVNSLLASPETGDFFDEEMLLGKDYDVIYQHSILFTYRKVECKALLDIVVVNNKAKTIQVFDIKTTGDYILNFSKSIRKFRYDIQLAFYSIALLHDIHNIGRIIGKDMDGYQMKHPAFIVESTVNPGNPVIVNSTNELYAIGLEGRDELFINELPMFPKILGINQLIDLYKWYKKNGFENEKLFAEKNNIVNADWSKLW